MWIPVPIVTFDSNPYLSKSPERPLFTADVAATHVIVPTLAVIVGLQRQSLRGKRDTDELLKLAEGEGICNIALVGSMRDSLDLSRRE